MQKSITVAYVEDEPSIAKLLASGLGLFGIRVNPIFMSAEDFLDNINSPILAEADMFMFDIRLPRMTGIQLAAKLREAGDRRPLVLVSAWPQPTKSELEAIQASFLPKPFDFSDVVQTIREMVWH